MDKKIRQVETCRIFWQGRKVSEKKQLITVLDERPKKIRRKRRESPLERQFSTIFSSRRRTEGESSTASAYRLRYIAKRADPRKYKEQAEQITDKVIASGKQPFRLSFTTASPSSPSTHAKNKRNRPLRDLFLLFWQGRKDSNPRPMVLETSTLPTELHPSATMVLYNKKNDLSIDFQNIIDEFVILCYNKKNE